MYRVDADAQVLYANPTWLAMTDSSMDRVPRNLSDWTNVLAKESYASTLSEWLAFVKSDEQRMVVEVQWKNERWGEFSAGGADAAHLTIYRLLADDRGFIACAVDITERKLNEEMQRQRVEDAELRRAEAEEARHQQELLIDITSHEMRNPVSSLMQCAALVRTNLVFLHDQFMLALQDERPFCPTPQLVSMVAEDLEALDSIYQCGLAQERICNDVLSLGKIQLNLLGKSRFVGADGRNV